DAVFEAALEAGADNVEEVEDGQLVTTSPETLAAVREALEARIGEPKRAEIVWRPTVTVAVDEEQAATLLKLVEALEDNDDVQRVSANFDVPDEVMERLAAA